MIIYSKSSGLRNAAIGKLETPIKMVIERESDLLSQQGGICEWLFNVEKSNRFGETIVNQSDFGIFAATEEGAGATQDTIKETGKKFIEHIQFTKEFVITAEMMEDANYGVGADAKRRVESFVRAYHKTRNKLCEAALVNGTSATASFAGTTIDLTCADGKPLFSGRHTYGDGSKTQSNYMFGNLLYHPDEADNRVYNPERFVHAFHTLCMKYRNMLDDNGEPLGYTADTIILPGNRPMFESAVKTLCGSEKIPFSANNAVNLHFGKWNIITLPGWTAPEDSLMLMSSEANRNLAGNMFFNRIPLSVSNWVDHHTGNYVWNGRCRFGIGFGSYKHILLAFDSYDGKGDASYFVSY